MPHQLSPSIIAADRAALKAIEELVDYQSVNPAYTTSQLQQMEATMSAAQQASERARRAYEQARAVESETTLAFHASMLAARSQVIVQYGDDSYAAQSVGRTRRSDRKRPVRRVAAAG